MKTFSYQLRFLAAYVSGALIAISPNNAANAAPAAACSSGETQQSFSFTAGSWANGATSNSYTVGTGANAVTLTFTSTNTGGSAFDTNFPGLAQSGNINNTLRHSHSNAPANSYLSTLTLTTSRPINKLKYIVTDVDYAANNWQDQFVVSADNGSSVFPTSIVSNTPANHTISLGTGTVTATTSSPNCSGTQAGCNLTVNYNLSNITTSTNDFRTGPAVATSTSQNIGWNSFEWCLPPAADLALSKSDGVASVNAGATVSYSIVVSNAGPSPANNAIFKDPAVANLTVSGVTCGSASGGAACPTSGNTTVSLMQGAGIVIPTLPSGGSITFTVTGTAGASGSISNTATIATPSGTTDPATANNSATDTDTINPVANLAISKSDGVSSVNAGGALTYVMAVSNAGPSAANNAVFKDPAVANLNVTNVACGSTSGGAVCPTAGNTTVALMQGAGIVIPSLPSGGSLTFTVTATAGTGSSISNVASITPPAGTTDLSPSNNTATDTDTILLPSLLFLKTVTATSDPVNGVTNPKFIPGADVLYSLRVTNTGPGTVTTNSVIITDPIPANTELFTGDLSGGAPFIYTDGSPTSGLACGFTSLGNTSDCVDFSNDGGSTWNYVPSGSYDPAVTNIRFKPSGTMNGDPVAGSPSPYFDLGFRVRIK